MRRHDGGMTADDPEGVEIVRGGAAPDEVAAVVAVLAALGEREGGPSRGAPAAGGYSAWRRTRLAALAQTDDSGDRTTY